MDIEQIANTSNQQQQEQEQEQESKTELETYHPMTAPPVDPQKAIDQAELDTLFVNEVQNNIHPNKDHLCSQNHLH